MKRGTCCMIDVSDKKKIEKCISLYFNMMKWLWQLQKNAKYVIAYFIIHKTIIHVTRSIST